MKTALFSLKNDISNISVEIRYLKKYIKDVANKDRSEQQSILYRMRCKARWMHIAYALLKGRSYEQIEKPAENNPPDWGAINAIQKAYAEKEEVSNAIPA
jgi:hypothetical protein